MNYLSNHLHGTSVLVRNWKGYSRQSFDENAIQQQFENLLNIDDTFISEIKEFEKCPHNYFVSQQSFLQLLWGYVNNHIGSVQKVRQYDNITPDPDDIINPIKAGICMNCIQKFIIITNGLNNIFAKWQNMLNSDIKWRSEFHHTNIIMIKQPIFLKWILLPCNIQSLIKIFNLFFVSFLQNTDLKSVVMKSTNERRNINIMHGIEHSISSLSTTINELIPLLKLYHIKHLFCKNNTLSNVARIMDEFVKEYVKMPHIPTATSMKKNSYEKFKDINKLSNWRRRILTDRLFAEKWQSRDNNGEPVFCLRGQRLNGDDIVKLYVSTKHVILQRLMRIFAMLYKKFRHYSRKLKKRNENQNQNLIYQLRMQKTTFEYLMNGKQQILTKSTSLSYKDKITMNDHIWSLVGALVPLIDNKSKEIIHNANIHCAFCHKQQKSETIKFKVCKYCQITYYCGKRCQKFDWNRNKHKCICKKLVASISCSQ